MIRTTLALTARLMAAALLLFLCTACGGTQSSSPAPANGGLGSDPSDPLSFLPDTTVGVFRFNPEAMRVHHEEHQMLWEATRCIGMDSFSCMYSGYFGREWPLLRNDNGDMSIRLLRALLRGAFEQAAENAEAGGVFPPPADADWLMAVVLPADVHEQLALWLPSPEPLPADSCVSNTSYVRIILPTPDSEAVREGVRDACAQALHRDDCEEHVRFLPAGEQVIVDVGRAEGCHEHARTWDAPSLRQTDDLHLVDDPHNVFAAHIRLDLLGELHRAFAWERFADRWEPDDSLPPDARLSVFIETAATLATLSDPRMHERLLHTLTLRLQQDQPGLALDIVARPTRTGQAVLDALATPGAPPATSGTADDPALLDVQIIANLPAALDTLRRIRTEVGRPLTFLPEVSDPTPLQHMMVSSTENAPARSIHLLNLMTAVLTSETDFIFEELRLLAADDGIVLEQPTSWEGLLPSSMTAAITPANEEGHTPSFTATFGVASPSLLIDTPLARIREDIERAGWSGSTGQGPASAPPPAAAIAPPEEEDELLDPDHSLHDATAITDEDSAEQVPPMPQPFEPLTVVRASPDAVHLTITTSDTLPPYEAALPPDNAPAGIHLTLRPWLHPEMGQAIDPEEFDIHALHPNHWMLGWLTTNHWAISLLLPSTWHDPHQPVTAFLRHEDGRLVGGLHTGDVDPLDLPAATPAPERTDTLPECFWRATRWVPFLFEAYWNAAPEDRFPITHEAATLLDEVADTCPPEHEEIADLIRAHGRAWTTWAETAFGE